MASQGNPGGRPTLRRGDDGEAVKEAQRLVGVDDDGSFGAITERAIQGFQRDVGLVDDGIVDAKTWLALLEPFSSNAGQSLSEHHVAPHETNTVMLGPNVRVHWATSAAFCGDTVHYTVTHAVVNQSVPIELLIERRRDGFRFDTRDVVAETRSYTGTYRILDVLPIKEGASLVPTLAIDAIANGRRTEPPLRAQFVTSLVKQPYEKDRAHFAVQVSEHEVLVSSDIRFTKGWGGQVVKLGAAVPVETGGTIGAPFPWSGYRWMKWDRGKNVFWDGDRWQPMPRDFVLIDANNFCVGFYKNGDKFTCQYGGDWPEKFAEWNLHATAPQQKLKDWMKNIKDTWTLKLDLKRKGCASSDQACCRYAVSASVMFVEQATFKNGMLIIAPGNIRSNDSLFFLGEPRLSMAAHEFGHHMGNPDEYAGARVNTSLNDDGAVAGIDADSIMGQNMSTVKARHLRTVCVQLSNMVRKRYGVAFTFEPVKS